MKFLTTTLALVGLAATSVLADGASIVTALTKVGGDAAALNTTVVRWDGTFLGAIPIITASAKLIGDIDDGTRTAQRSANLTTPEALNVYTAVVSLQSTVNITLTNLINSRKRFDKVLLTGIVKADLQLTKQETDKLAAAIVAKVSPDLQPIALSVVQSIDASFNQAIAAYS